MLPALLALAMQHHQSGRLAEAEALYRRILAADPRHADSLHLLGLCAQQSGHPDRALELIRQAIAIAPHVPLYHANLGNVLETLGQHDAAIASHRCSIAADPGFIMGHKNLGTVLFQQGRLDEAAACFRQALALDPDHAESRNNLAGVLFRQGRMAEAAACYRALLRLDPADAPTHLNLAEALLAQDQVDAAIASYRRALAVRPDWPDVQVRLGAACARLADHAAAIGCYDAAIRAEPDNAVAHVNRAIALLASGDMPRGWAEYEWRWRMPPIAGTRRDFAQPQWRGEPAAGRTLLVHAEQGFGDTLQFCRYVPLAHDRGLRVILEARPPLLRLLATLRGVDRLVAPGDPLPPFDLHCPMLSLPLAFGTTVATIPDAVPYLRADPAEAAAWAERLAAPGARGPRVGIAWAGNPEPDFDRRRSIAPDRLAPLLSVPRPLFVCLQETGFPRPAGPTMLDPMAEVADFADTAAVIANLDLVVTVDTAVVHLAGALGKPVWLLCRFDGDWRWLTGRRDSPWYPTLRLFRQPRPGDWDSVLAEVAAALGGIAG